MTDVAVRLLEEARTVLRRTLDEISKYSSTPVNDDELARSSSSEVMSMSGCDSCCSSSVADDNEQSDVDPPGTVLASQSKDEGSTRASLEDLRAQDFVAHPRHRKGLNLESICPHLPRKKW